jgi:hypothetical protein
MDKKQMREAIKGIKGSLPRMVTVNYIDNAIDKTLTANAVDIEVGKGYGGTYTMVMEGGERFSTIVNDEVRSLEIDGVIFDRPSEKKIYATKQEMDETHARNLMETFSSLSAGTVVKLSSLEDRYNTTFRVVGVAQVHAPFKQTKLQLQNMAGDKNFYLLSRRDSVIIRSCEVVPEIDDSSSVDEG